MHPELRALLAALEAAEADATSIVAGLSDAQGNWQPGGGTGWSIAQCLDHLAKINHFYMTPFLDATRTAYASQRLLFNGVRPTWFGRKWVSILEPPVRQKAKAPGAVQPQSSIPIADALARYVESHEPYRQLVELAPHVDVNRVRAGNPFFTALPVRVATALLVVPAHDRRHLWQAKRVLESPDFPR